MNRFLVSLLWFAAAGFPAHAETLRVMTFNVRFPSPNDGANVWENRRDLLVETIQRHQPDIIGTQELFREQGDYIVSRAPEYSWFGLSRRGNHEDEHMGVFYRKNKLHLIESGNFWLSDKPDVPGSMSWNVSLPRMVTWGLFSVEGSGRRFYFYNTHFPHRREDEAARVQCATLLRKRIEQLPAEATVVLTGDFNTGASSEAHRQLTGILKDSWEETSDRKGTSSTFHGFKGQSSGPRIDWILWQGNLAPKEVQTISDHRGELFPSDHFPVLADLEWR